MIATTGHTIDKFNRANLRILKELGFSCAVATDFRPATHWSNPRLMGELAEDSVRCYQINSSRKLAPGSFARQVVDIRKIMFSGQFGVIHVQTPIAAAAGRVAAATLPRTRRPIVIYTAHGFHFFTGGPRRRWALFVGEWVLSFATDVLVTINDEDYQRARKYFHTVVYRIPGVGVDEQTVTASTGREATRASLGVRDDTTLVLAVGELTVRKNHDHLIQAASLLKDHGKSFKVLIAGGGPEQGHLEQVIAQLGLQNEVKLLGYRDDIPNLLAAADMLVSTAKQEGLPVNILEAMVESLPVIATNIRGSRDLVRDGKTGFVLRSNDPSELANAIERLALDPELRLKMGVAGRELVRQYAPASVDDQMRTIYLSTIAGSRR